MYYITLWLWIDTKIAQNTAFRLYFSCHHNKKKSSRIIIRRTLFVHLIYLILPPTHQNDPANCFLHIDTAYRLGRSPLPPVLEVVGRKILCDHK